MIENSYGIPYLELIDDFNNLKIGKYHYQLNDVDFMVNKKEHTEKLLIVFHAKVDQHTKIPVFHKHDFEMDNVSVLSIGDAMLNKYKYVESTCYVDLVGMNFHKKYIKIIEEVIKNLTPNKTLFYGSCSGAYPALYFGCHFNGIIICSNPYIYLNDFMACYSKRSKIDLKNTIIPSIETKILESSPTYIHLYSNEGENYLHKQSVNFVKFCTGAIPNKIKYIFHDTSDTNISCHLFLTPKNESFESIIQNI